MAVTSKKDFLSFILAFWKSWFTSMSGGLSVPLAIAALFVESIYAKIGMAVLAITCFVAASYAVWRREREKIEKQKLSLDEFAQTRAELEIKFNEEGEPYLVMDAGRSYCRFSIYNKGPAPAKNVRVWINDINPRPNLPVGYYPLHYPSLVAMVTRVDAIELQINKNEEIWFEPWDTSLPEANHFIFNKIGALTAQIHAHTGDSWRMTFSVHAENANEINFIMSVAAANDKMVATLAR